MPTLRHTAIAAAVALIPAAATAQPSLTDALLFQANAGGANIIETGVAYGIWNTGHAPWWADFFISTTPAPAPTWTNPSSAIDHQLAPGANTLWFYADQYDPRGYAGFFGLNLHLAGAASPTISGLVPVGATGTVTANSNACTPPLAGLACQPAAGTLSATVGTWNVALTGFQVLGIGSNNQGGAQPAPQSAIDVVGSFSTGPNGLFDTYGTITLTVTSTLPQTPVPEPSTWALLATGLGALGVVIRRRRV